ncbi:reverse transcriptase domain protein [Colletotrichum truncatum]|uniref:Reverse transcriptase domain protein n=1 Tax=Colletotrichum truncatum TaxID=5467 RepID=A0ACC3YKG1_COLTU|nr:reverse transcriptase domain protein [Colletotrichum truncatum]KAF6784424.1 reverse transcriptase domain protein [Colletotrichum truncatum]
MSSIVGTAKYMPRLQSDSDWHRWFSSLRMIANVHGVWEYVDPNGTKMNIEPTHNFEDPAGLSGEEKASYSTTMLYRKAIYKAQDQKYNRIRKALADVHIWILSTIADIYFSQIYKAETVRDVLKVLQSEVAPRDFGRQKIVLDRYHAHMRSIKRTNLGEWLLVYKEIIDEAESIEDPTLCNPEFQVVDFIKAVWQIAPSYAIPASFASVPLNEEEPADHLACKSAGIKQADHFRRWVRIFNPDWLTGPPAKASRFGQCYGEDEKEHAVSNNISNNQRSHSSFAPKCPACPGSSHRFVDCKHANPQKRDPSYNEASKENQKALQRLEDYLEKNPHLRGTIKRLRDKSALA